MRPLQRARRLLGTLLKVRENRTSVQRAFAPQSSVPRLYVFLYTPLASVLTFRHNCMLYESLRQRYIMPQIGGKFRYKLLLSNNSNT